MSRITSQQISDLYQHACTLDVAAFKPGNVSHQSAGHGMVADQFLASAQVSAKVITNPSYSLGQRILEAVGATQQAVGCNTNLGIILLCAPIIQAVIDYPELSLQDAVRNVLAASQVDDSSKLFAAIRMANPGGLGQSDAEDVSGVATLPLIDVMTLAAQRDLIARQYSNGFYELQWVVQPYLATAIEQHGEEVLAVTDLFLYLLALYQDSHIERKQGSTQAATVCRWAAAVHQKFLETDQPSVRQQLLIEMDRKLKQQSINPGTTADLCVAGVFIHHLQKQVIHNTGVARNYPRMMKPSVAETPQIL
ncbi:MAG: triphosphoribosyl-dephospho-CoA synthase [Sedimenticola thiotaurini]|uniref:Triphosphoribosyl-dephospho-CoA synthase n=1 Tax=Sedimenticola thiotaurini TaxID=1543721 RepID=A0A558D8M8_9GAMM|nr:MAG: triphosphoribosyl-dephospho-CoA synthase [Sedimenticola thiotaurini]